MLGLLTRCGAAQVDHRQAENGAPRSLRSGRTSGDDRAHRGPGPLPPRPGPSRARGPNVDAFDGHALSRGCYAGARRCACGRWPSSTVTITLPLGGALVPASTRPRKKKAERWMMHNRRQGTDTALAAEFPHADCTEWLIHGIDDVVNELDLDLPAVRLSAGTALLAGAAAFERATV